MPGKYLLLINNKPAGIEANGYTYYASGRTKAATASTLAGVRRLIAAAQRHDANQEQPYRYNYRYDYCLLAEATARAETRDD